MSQGHPIWRWCPTFRIQHVNSCSLAALWLVAALGPSRKLYNARKALSCSVKHVQCPLCGLDVFLIENFVTCDSNYKGAGTHPAFELSLTQPDAFPTLHSGPEIYQWIHRLLGQMLLGECPWDLTWFHGFKHVTSPYISIRLPSFSFSGREVTICLLFTVRCQKCWC